MPGHRLVVVSLVVAALITAAPGPATSQPPADEHPVARGTGDAPSRGPDNAPVTIVEFVDFQCAFCARNAQALRGLLATHPSGVRWVFKHYPLLTLHPDAALAHEAAVAAQEQGKFWEMHALIFRNQTRVAHGDLVGYAEKLGLDMAAFKDALDSRRLRPRVLRDMEEARRRHVVATPTYFVNGVRYIGARPTAEFRTIVDAIIAPPTVAPPSVAPPAGPDTSPGPPGPSSGTR